LTCCLNGPSCERERCRRRRRRPTVRKLSHPHNRSRRERPRRQDRLQSHEQRQDSRHGRLDCLICHCRQDYEEERLWRSNGCREKKLAEMSMFEFERCDIHASLRPIPNEGDSYEDSKYRRTDEATVWCIHCLSTAEQP
jgi:hypothetical protein